VRFSDAPVSAASLAAAVRGGRVLLGTLASAPLAAAAEA
jgi:ABC-type taurine transport system substrate-binding protein